MPPHDEPDATQNIVQPSILDGQEPLPSAQAAEGKATGPMTDEIQHARENALQASQNRAAVEKPEVNLGYDEPVALPTNDEPDVLATAHHSDSADVLDEPEDVRQAEDDHTPDNFPGFPESSE